MSSQFYNDQIPQDWEIKKISEVFEISAGGDLSRLAFSPIKTDKFSNPIYSNAISNNGLYGYSSDFDYEGNFVTVTARGYIGYAVARNGRFCSIGRLLNLKPKIDISCFYVAEYINQFIEFALESTGVAQLTAPQILKYEILLPKDKEEQERIAQVLSDMDDLIGAKCELLDKKFAIKQAVAQQLLTSKPHWHTATLGEICKYIKTGKLDANAMEENGEFPFFTCAKKVYRINKYNFDLEALLISGNGANVGYIHYYKGKFNAYQRTYVLSDFSCNIFYLKNFLDLKLQERIEKEVRSGNTPYITMDTLVDMWISFPNLSEQTKIAKILSDMDDEISALQDEIEKLKMIKQGAMDELLSGKIRLKG